MSGHTRWWMKDSSTVPADEFMIHHVQGYILALEDMLRDIDQATFLSTSSRDYAMGHDHALGGLKHQVEESRDSARRTLDILVKKVDDAQ